MPEDALIMPTNQEMLDFLEEKWSRLQCDCCSETTWGIGEKDSQRHVALPIVDENVLLQDGYAGFYAVFCDNCGYTRFIVGSVVAQWVRARRDVNGGA